MKFGIDMKISELTENEAAVRVFDTWLPGVRSMIEQNPKATELSVRNVLKYMGEKIPSDVLSGLSASLEQLNITEDRISPSEKKKIELYQQMEKQRNIPGKSESAKSENTESVIRPGQTWLDTDGKRIQAHGGAVFYENGTYYWYGENKEFTDGTNGVWTWGIRMYSSKDLYHWEDMDLIIPPVLDDPDSNLFPTKRLDRPHILKCEKTGKYVCWIKLSGAEACFVVLQSDHLEGPYDIVYENYQPNGIGIGDFDLILDDKTGKAYLYFDQNHRGMVTMELADDFCSAKEEICRQYENLTPPFTREAPAVFHHDGKFYMITSGMTGYIPNKSDLAISDGLEKEFISLGNPHEEDDSCASFNSQISKIFHVEGSDLWIAMADRWVPDFPIDANMADIFTRAIASHYDPKHFSATEEEHKILENSATLETAQTKFSEYVWLPILFDEKGIPYIKWFDEWAVNEFI